MKVVSNLSAELRSRYQDIEELSIFKDNVKQWKTEIPLKDPKVDKVAKLQSKIKDSDGKIAKKKIQEATLKDIREYNLSKYTSELAQTIIDCQLHQANVKFFIELAVTLSIYEDFPGLLYKSAIRQIELLDSKGGNYENEQKRALKRKNLLRLFAELHQVLYSNEQFIEIFKLLTPIRNIEFLLPNIKVVSNFMQHCSFDYFETHTYQERKDIDENPSLHDIYRTKKCNQLEQLMQTYIAHVEQCLKQIHAQIVELSTNNQQSINDASDDPRIKELKEQFTTIKDAYRIIKDSYGCYDPENQVRDPVLDLYVKDFEYIKQNVDCFTEHEKKLYLNLIKITEVVEGNTKRELSSIEVADQMAIEFQNSKPNRKKLLDEIINYKANYMVLIPYQCRLLTTLARHYKDFEEEIIKIFLEAYKMTRQDQPADRKSRYLRYICELTKFRLFKQDIILDMFQQLLEELTGQNIELIVVILENCGRFLKFSQESSRKFQFQLDQLAKLRASKPLAAQHDNQLQNALLSLSLSVKIYKDKPILQRYVKHLIFNKIDDFAEFIKHIQSLDLVQCQEYLIKYILKIIVKGRFQTLKLVAGLLAVLKDRAPIITGIVVDALFEEIYCGLENNQVNLRQKRITIIRMIGELYVYQIVDRDLIFTLLYAIIERDLPKIEQDLIDPPEDSFRINMILNLLDTLREYHTKLKPQLLYYLTHFQRYVLQKKYLPQTVEFSILDLYEIVDNRLSRIKNFKQADQICQSKDDIEELLNSIEVVKIPMKIEAVAPQQDQSRQLEIDLEQQFNRQLNEYHQEAMLKKQEISSQLMKKNYIAKPVTKGDGEVKVVQRQEQQFNKKKQRQMQNQQLQGVMNFNI